MSKPTDLPSIPPPRREPSSSDMSLQSLMAASGALPYGRDPFSPLPLLDFQLRLLPPSSPSSTIPHTMEERRYHLLRVINIALAIVNEVDLQAEGLEGNDSDADEQQRLWMGVRSRGYNPSRNPQQQGPPRDQQPPAQQ